MNPTNNDTLAPANEALEKRTLAQTQTELPLPLYRATREEAAFLLDMRRLREQLRRA